ncbi:hypothetical protein ACGFMM_14360 [Streptomyces sp. NPDC048604]|uniref:hypothetical protein n=1 Tax=Streptomyces sp. NPDC048604 TaxID=3365578 RepID=UPI0037157C76
MGKKQTRRNAGARTGGHAERTPPTESRPEPQRSPTTETTRAISEPSHRKERKFGHN